MSESIIRLPTDLTIAQVEEFKNQVIDQIEENQEILIDDSSLIRIDTSGIQLILAIITHIISLNKKLSWQCESTCIKESLKQLGINDPILNQYIQV